MKLPVFLLQSYWYNIKYVIILIISTFSMQYTAFLYKSQVQNMLNHLDKSYYDIFIFGSIFLLSISLYAFISSIIKVTSDTLALKINLYCADRALNNISRQNYQFFTHQSKDLTTYIYDLMNIVNLIKYSINTVGIFSHIFGGLIFLILQINLIIGLFISCWFVTTIYFSIKYQREMILSTKNFLSERSKFTNYIAESYKNAFTLVTYGSDNKSFFSNHLNNLYEKAEGQRLSKQKNEFVLFLSIFTLFSGFLLLAFFLKDYILDIGDITMAVTQCIEIFLSFIIFFRTIGDLSEEYAKANRSIENLLNDKYIDKNAIDKNFQITKIQFKNINTNGINFNFEILKGQRKAIYDISNKTYLILNLLKIENKAIKKIYVNNINLTQINQQNILSNISFVNENIEIFNANIKKNIFLHIEPSKYEIDRILNMVELYEFVNMQTEKLEYILSNNLHEDIKIKIGIARALVKNANIFIFDKSFSRLRENFFIDQLDKELSTKTIIFIESKKDDLPKIQLDN